MSADSAVPGLANDEQQAFLPLGMFYADDCAAPRRVRDRIFRSMELVLAPVLIRLDRSRICSVPRIDGGDIAGGKPPVAGNEVTLLSSR